MGEVGINSPAKLIWENPLRSGNCNRHGTRAQPAEGGRKSFHRRRRWFFPSSSSSPAGERRFSSFLTHTMEKVNLASFPHPLQSLKERGESERRPFFSPHQFAVFPRAEVLLFCGSSVRPICGGARGAARLMRVSGLLRAAADVVGAAAGGGRSGGGRVPTEEFFRQQCRGGGWSTTRSNSVLTRPMTYWVGGRRGLSVRTPSFSPPGNGWWQIPERAGGALPPVQEAGSEKLGGKHYFSLSSRRMGNRVPKSLFPRMFQL